jgi:peptidoglycan/LPS O-acetylase OafA/YrhL
MTPPLPVDPQPQRQEADHWRRFRRLMVVMTLAAVVTAGLAIAQMRADGVPLRWHFMVAMGGGIVIALLLAGVLMGLAFVSNRSGHDEAVNTPDE